METAELIRRMKYIERKLKLEYYIDAQREVEEILHLVARTENELSENEREFLIADRAIGDGKP